MKKIKTCIAVIMTLIVSLLQAQDAKKQLDLLASFRDGQSAPMYGVGKIVFAVRTEVSEHWYANFGYYADDENKFLYRHSVFSNTLASPGGKLCVYDIDTKDVQILLDDPEGTVRDPQVHYGGDKILFSYHRGGTNCYHLYEIHTDGSGLKQLTDGDFDDIEPAYLPDGNIIFVSSRAKRWVNCWLTQVAILYGCNADGKNIHPLSGNIEQDNTPWVLPDGQILYTRWEYVDRSQVDYHHLWTMNPDGTRQMVFYGNMYPGTVFIDAKPVPNSDKIVASFSWRHGRTEHAGSIGLIDHNFGPDERSAARKISEGNNYRDPWAFSEVSFMAAKGAQMILMDGNGNEQVIFDLPEEWKSRKLLLHEPRPLVRRQPELQTVSTVNPSASTGRLMLTNVYHGRNMKDVKKGEIKKLLILESLPKPINFTGGMEPLTFGGSFTLERIVGTVPVDPDGSAYFELPALRSFFFVALDENDMAVKRMQSFLSVMPGEQTSCIGCHETRTEAPQQAVYPTAVRRKPSPVTAIADFRGVDAFGNRLSASTGIPDVIDFSRDIQPILDANCIKCHSPEKRSGNVSLVGDRGPMYSISYYTITAKSLVADGRNRPVGNYPPRTLGSGASKLLKYCDGLHHGAKPSEREKTLLRLWIETGAAYIGTYAGLGSGMIGGYEANHLDRQDLQWPETQAMDKVLKENCMSCHTNGKLAPGAAGLLPLSASHEIAHTWWIADWNDGRNPDDVRRKYARHLLYDLTHPEKSVLLLAPLAKSEGGYESCGSAILTDKDDPRYQTILAGIERAKKHLDKIKRFDMADFVPRPQYIRELKKYEILPQEHDPSDIVDCYELEQKYWRSLWYKPVQYVSHQELKEK